MLSLTAHLQSVILQCRYRYNHIIVKSCTPIRFFNGLINQSFGRYVALCMHNFLAKPLISAYTRHCVCTKPCRQPSHTNRTVVINKCTEYCQRYHR